MILDRECVGERDGDGVVTRCPATDRRKTVSIRGDATPPDRVASDGNPSASRRAIDAPRNPPSAASPAYGFHDNRAATSGDGRVPFLRRSQRDGMNCYRCAERGLTAAAVGICPYCRIGLCVEHLHEARADPTKGGTHATCLHETLGALAAVADSPPAGRDRTRAPLVLGHISDA